MVKCPECGEEVSDNNFCGHCGAKLKKENVCPHCNAKIEEDNIFCPECGKKLEEDSESDKKDQVTDDKSPEKEDESEVKYCPHCNAKIYDSDAYFCEECGKKIEIDEQSFEGIMDSIEFNKLAILSFMGIIFGIFISLIFSYIFTLTNVDGYVIGFLITLFLTIGFFGSFFNKIINSGLLGIIVGLVVGLLSTAIVEMSGGFTFSYDMLSGYGALVYTIFGFIIGLISIKFLKKYVLKLVDVDNML